MIKSLQTIFQKNYHTLITGSGFEKKIYLYNDKNQRISFWNDVPLKENDFKDDEYNICIEIPRFKISKMEVCKNEESHPIVQDTRQNKFTNEMELRYYAQFPYFNYGYLPQTWENSFIQTKEGFKGDDDPLDVCDLSIKEAVDFDKYQPKRLQAIQHWFKYIKTYDGKKPNTIYYEGKIFDSNYTYNVIEEMHQEWKKLYKENNTDQLYIQKAKEFKIFQ
ncbi:Inorganic pyrophosphatase [Pseudocohnilembus persalinus]|uniref:inorganic diphosphatase n=1 Tax=Pseudocohnilembus persalinus TaxID=266149 RepID=A0A0V0QIF6_PSEPJ|nr:Inorganic pyrophosphatase [Pseudocohnilembus persalinus]|eukprot:KRX01993.1 Inorganic pyrophosphatase [Pseudocohnilembus persalinus]